MSDIKIIALDLDNTLLNSKKELSPKNAAALCNAAALGIEIVPTTGRFYKGMPECIRSLPFLHYAITINGAQVYDIAKDTAVARAEIALPQSLEIMAYLDQLPVIYDCYQENWGYMTASMQERALSFVPDPHYRKMVRQLRSPVPDLKDYIQSRGVGVQKIQLFTDDVALRNRLLVDLAAQFPDTAVSSAVPINVEINAANAHKGNAIRALADYLGYDMAQTMGFGDGLNDLTMLRETGIGVAMGNACPEALAAADYVTIDCDDDGVAHAIEKLILNN